MAGPIVGTIEHYFAGAGLTTASVQTFFVNCYNFLNNNTGSLGVQRIAFNTGSKDTCMTLTRGMNFYDQSNPAGQNAFACFRFLSASVPFDVLIQWTGGSAAEKLHRIRAFRTPPLGASTTGVPFRNTVP
jgi:hypothetical protein